MDFIASLFDTDEGTKQSTKGSRSAPKVKLKRPSCVLDDESGGDKLDFDNLPPEKDEGNVEYKLRMVSPFPDRFEHLVTQMKWRLREGLGEAIYEIGVEDCGRCTGLTESEMVASLNTLKRMAYELKASITILRNRHFTGPNNDARCLAEVLVRKIADHQQFIDLRIAVLGAADAGKSTLLGVLTQGELDNGNGRSRLNLFRHMHEVQTGRTSSISMDIVGFDAEGKALKQFDHSVEEIYDKAAKMITFIDLAGHQKYMRTTLFGLTGYKPHFVALVVAADTGIVYATKDHTAWAVALEVPFFIVITKIDKILSYAKLDKLLSGLEFFLKQPCYSRICARIRTEDDAISIASSFTSSRVVPIFTVSNVTGENLSLLERFFNLLPSYSIRDLDSQLQEDPEFQIDEVFNVPDVGLVACGLLSNGVVREGDHLTIGPDAVGCFAPVIAETLQRNRTPCRLIRAGQSAAISLGYFSAFTIRKGMVIVGQCNASKAAQPKAVLYLLADIYVIHHPYRFIAENFQCTVYVGNVCQTAVVIRIDNETRSVGVRQSAKVLFKFLRNPEYVLTGNRLIFREGRTKGIGRIIRVHD